MQGPFCLEINMQGPCHLEIKMQSRFVAIQQPEGFANLTGGGGKIGFFFSQSFIFFYPPSPPHPLPRHVTGKLRKRSLA